MQLITPVYYFFQADQVQNQREKAPKPDFLNIKPFLLDGFLMRHYNIWPIHFYKNGFILKESSFWRTFSCPMDAIRLKYFSASLRAYFEAFGVVRDIEIKIDSATGMSRGFGFVLFETEDSVNAVCQTHEHFLGKLMSSTSTWGLIKIRLDFNVLLDGKKIDPKRAEKRNAKIFCGGLKPDTTDEAIKGVFSQYGEIELFER